MVLDRHVPQATTVEAEGGHGLSRCPVGILDDGDEAVDADVGRRFRAAVLCPHDLAADSVDELDPSLARHGFEHDCDVALQRSADRPARSCPLPRQLAIHHGQHAQRSPLTDSNRRADGSVTSMR